ncbi:MAG: alpha-amylase [Acutalibacteraceae bacterium]|nr:alpha-amylase [Acutalibacteraceae bacterium]
MENKTMMQYFEWYLPNNGLFWDRCVVQADKLLENGINMLWLPPAYKGATGKDSVGYDVYDTYDLGEFDQRGSVATKYGTRDAYLNAVQTLQNKGIEVLADIVLNHMTGADELEEVVAVENNPENREEDISEPEKRTVWTKYTFPGRAGKYSDFTWNYTHFNGTDWDEEHQQFGIFLFDGKAWNSETDSEFANFDYLMGTDLDMENPETVEAVTNWGKWYLDTVRPNGFRIDAVKHIRFEFYRDWLKVLREHYGYDFFAVGEYWSSEIDKLTHYLDVVEDSMSLFDVPLHFSFQDCSYSNGAYDMRQLLENTLVKLKPENAVTFVDNHDTQPGQSLFSFIPTWFKPIAYALILLRSQGLPCVFYGDYYGIPNDNIPPVPTLKKLIYLRKKYAYGEQEDYFDDDSVVGFVRRGDDEHENSGMAVLMTNAECGSKIMNIGQKFAGRQFYNVIDLTNAPVTIDEEGNGEFFVDGGSVSVWVNENVYRDICLNIE